MKTLLLSLFLASTLAAHALDDPRLPKDATLEEKIELTRQYLGCPGAAVIVHRAGKPLIERGFGIANRKTQEAVTITTPFRVGSLAKPFIGTVILQLADEGKLALDDPISKYVDGVPAGDTITLRHLGMNTSGLYNYIAAPEVKTEFSTHPERRWTPDELLALAFAHPPHFTPSGDGFVYANTNTLLLAKVIEKLTGLSAERAVAQRIIEPLGLKDTRFDDATEPPGARGYQFGDEKGPIHWRGAGTVLYDVSLDSPTKWGAAGALVSNAADLLRFTRALTHGQLVSPAMWAEQTRWRHCGYPLDYSYGFQLSKLNEAIGHAGQIPGYQACIALLPAEDIEIVVCTNLYSSSNYEEPANWIMFVIAEHFTGKAYRYHLE